MKNEARLQLGAKNAIQVAMKVGSKDRVFIVTDQETLNVARALEQESLAAGAKTVCVCLEDFGDRPMTSLPKSLLEKITSFSPSVTFYAATIRENELPLRSGLFKLAVEKLHARHAHMPGIDEKMMMEGMTTDYKKVNKITQRVYKAVRNASTIHVTSSDGTDITACFDKKYTWIPLGGIYHKTGDSGNLPEGEVCTCPASVDGVFVAQVLGDYFSVKYGILAHPLKVEIVNSQAKSAKSDQKNIAKEFINYLDSAKNGRRVGEFSIGTNLGVTSLCGRMLQDEKIPGIHIAFGDPLGHWTNADWSSKIHVDAVNPKCNIDVNGKPLMKNGRFV